MSPSAATAAGRAPGLRRSPASRVPRRVSGPARPARPARPRPHARSRIPTATRPAPARSRVALGAARRLRALPDARLLDRLVRGRAWIAIVAVALMGIVFMQVSMLQLNAGIGRAVTSADTLERQNSTLRAQISELDSGERIQNVATDLGMVMPAAGDVRFLDARQADGARAAANVTAPAPAATATQATAVQTPTGQAAHAAVQPQASPAAQAAQAAQPAAPPATATTAAAATPPATTQPQASPPQSPTPATAAAATPGAAAAPPASTSAGGVSAPGAQR